MIVESAHWPCCVTLRPRASHNPSYVGLHTDTSFRILLFAYAMMKSRVRRCAVTICEKRATWLSDKAGRVRERANRPTVSLDAISLVASSCGHYRGHIEQRAAHEFAVHVATQHGLAKRIQYRHPPRARPVAPMRERHCRGPRLKPRHHFLNIYGYLSRPYPVYINSTSN